MTEQSGDGFRLRRMLCAAISGHKAYMDDGEAQDNTVLPFIDYLRDSVDMIESKLRERRSSPPPTPEQAGPSGEALTMKDAYWLSIRGRVINALAAEGLEIVSNKDQVWLKRSPGAMEGAQAAIEAERARAAAVCDDEARIRTEAASKHGAGTLSYDRCMAAARAAINCAKGIRSGEVIEGAQADRIERLQHAIEGECDGLAVDRDHARAILEYVEGAQAAQPEPAAWMWQHAETGMTGFVEHASPEELAHFERMNKPRKIVAPLYAHPPTGEPT